MPGARGWRIGLRSVHVIAAAALFGGAVHGVPREELAAAFAATLVTGSALAAFELYRSPLWLAQLRGASALAKVGLVLLALVADELRVPLFALALVLGVVTAHMPGRLRYRSWWDGRLVGPQERG